MTIRVSADGTIELLGVCPSEDAEALLQHLLRMPDAAVDWRACEAAHSAVIQLLLASGRRVLGPPVEAGLARWLQPVLARERD